MPITESHLRDLISQWRETVMLYETSPYMREAASGYRECIAELEQVLRGDLRAIEPMHADTASDRDRQACVALRGEYLRKRAKAALLALERANRDRQAGAVTEAQEHARRIALRLGGQ
jgi:hypothetical protein